MQRFSRTCRTSLIFITLFFFLGPRGTFAEKERVIVAFGDSLTAGLGVASDQTYPALLDKKLKALGHPYKVINAGVSGETTAGGLRRVSWILKSEPDVVILELGANDGLRGLSLLEMEKNLSGIIQKLQNRDVQVILAGMKIPPNYGARYTQAFAAIYPRLAARFDITLIPFFLEGVAAKPALNQADGIHPTAEGYAVITEQIWPIIQKVIPMG
ncbi:MAG: arylesterase [Nitrospiria bacterium]